MQYTDLEGDHFPNIFLKKILKINRKNFLRIKKGYYICTRIQEIPDETKHWRIGRVVECGSLENC